MFGIGSANSITIDCESCVMQHSSACDDCVVSFICDRDPEDAIVVNADEHRAIQRLSAGGMIPELRLVNMKVS